MQQHEIFARAANERNFNRRGFLTRLASGILVVASSGGATFAEELVRTPWQTEGPFYPNLLPLDKDNDLIVVSNSITRAVGEVTHLSGRILDANGSPVKGASSKSGRWITIGVYLHNGSDNFSGRDKNFQGLWPLRDRRVGRYRFRTIKPVPYPGRTPHIHVKVKKAGARTADHQVYVKEIPKTRATACCAASGTRRRASRSSWTSRPCTGSKIGERAARFDIVLGVTPTAA
jgi:protocatechuate 3,4-dioxygenase beta subunit